MLGHQTKAMIPFQTFFQFRSPPALGLDSSPPLHANHRFSISLYSSTKSEMPIFMICVYLIFSTSSPSMIYRTTAVTVNLEFRWPISFHFYSSSNSNSNFALHLRSPATILVLLILVLILVLILILILADGQTFATMRLSTPPAEWRQTIVA